MPTTDGRYFCPLQPVHHDKEHQPDHINKVPVPRDAFEREVVVRFEVAFEATNPDANQHDGTNGHVKSVKASQHVKRGAINPGRQFQVQFGIRMAVFECLKSEEQDAKAYRRKQPEIEQSPFVFLQGPMRDGQSDT